MKRVVSALFVTALLSAPAAWARDDHDHGHGHGWGHEHERKEWKHERHEWERHRGWDARRGYYYQEPRVVQQYYYRPAPPIVYEPQPVYQPYYTAPAELSFNFRVPLN